MENKVVYVLGGDLRQIFAAKALAGKNTVYAIGFDNAQIEDKGNVIFSDLDSVDEKADIVIFPLPACEKETTVFAPFSKNAISAGSVLMHIKSSTLIFGGKINRHFSSMFLQANALTIDYSESEQFSILNALPTAEGAVMLALEEMPITLFGIDVLITGFGRISRALVPILKGFGARITVAARSYEALSWAKIMGCNAIHISELDSSIGKFGLIYNTVPARILSKDVLSKVNPRALIIDLASKPGGVDFEAAGSLGLKTLWALSLPGKTAPESAGIIISETIDNILTERGVT